MVHVPGPGHAAALVPLIVELVRAELAQVVTPNADNLSASRCPASAARNIQSLLLG